MVTTLKYVEGRRIKDVKKEVENKSDFFILGCSKLFNTYSFFYAVKAGSLDSVSIVTCVHKFVCVIIVDNSSIAWIQCNS